MSDYKPTILVTGGAGYIGSHACKSLARAGYEPVVYDNLVHGHEWAVKWGPLEKGDILDRARLDEVLARYRPEAVMHFAAFAYVGESVFNPAKYYRNNVVGTLTLLDAMVSAEVSKLIFSSSCATFGIPTVLPITEETAQVPINPYGASKAMAERMLDDFRRAHGLRSTALRYFNAGGADPDGEIGEMHDPETHLIPVVLDAASGRRGPLTVHGNDYDTPDGTCIRDYVHVSDLADAHVLALTALKRDDHLPVCNLGNGRGYSVCQVIEAVEQVSGLTVPYQFGPRRPGDPASLIADAALAREHLGWEPRRSNLSSIVGTAWSWQSSLLADKSE